MNTHKPPQPQPSSGSPPVPGGMPPDVADMAGPDGRRLEPIHPDDIDADSEPLGNGQAANRNPLADSPDDGE